MAIQIQGNGGVVADVDGTTFRALRVTARPLEYGALGYYRLAMQTGTMAVSLAANSEIFQFRYTPANFAVVHDVALSCGPNAAAALAVLAAFRVTAARAWSVAGSGGTRATLTGNNAKLRTSMASSGVNDAGISSTAALTAGTKTLDTQDLGSYALGIGTGAITVDTRLVWSERIKLFDCDAAVAHPLVCTSTGGGEGFVVRVGANAFPAGATWIGAVDVAWAEVTTF